MGRIYANGDVAAIGYPARRSARAACGWRAESPQVDSPRTSALGTRPPLWFHSLGIPDEVEQAWNREYLKRLLHRFAATDDSERIMHLFSDIGELAFFNCRSDAAEFMVGITQQVVERLTDPLHMGIVAESLVGRTESLEDGFIYQAYKDGDKDSCRSLIKAALDLAARAEDHRQQFLTADDVRQKVRQLSERLLGENLAPVEANATAVLYLVGENQEWKLMDPSPEEATAHIRLVDWSDDCPFRLHLHPHGEGREATIRIWSLKKSPFRIWWDQKRPEGADCRTDVETLDAVIEIVVAALAGEEVLRAAADWQTPRPC